MRTKDLKLSVCVLAICSFIASPALAQTPIKIGWPNSFSPPGNVIGAREAKVGAEIALDFFKEKYGPKVDGREIEIIYEDTHGDPEAARSAMEKLENKDQVDVAAGCNHSSEGIVLARIAHENKTGFVLMNCWSDDIRNSKYDEVFGVSNYLSRTSIAITGFIKAQNAKTFTILAENTDFGIGQAKQIEEKLKREIPSVVTTIKLINKTSRDMRDEIIALRANPPDVVGVAMVAPQGILLTSQMDELGLTPSTKTKVVDIGGYVDQPGFWDSVKEAGVGTYAYVLDHKSNPVTELGRRAQDEYRKRAHAEPTRFALQGFDSTWVALMAIKESNAKSRAAIIDALKKTKVQGSRGEIVFTNDPLWQQWPDIPFAVVQMEKVGQPPADAKLIFPAKAAN
jgi:branched-chain amino acid transport system substrate-binding protein